MSARRAAVPAAVLAVACAGVFLASPHREPGDGSFALLTSESLVRDGSFDLDRVVPPGQLEGEADAGPLRLVDGHVRIATAPGTALWSVPFAPLIDRAPPGLPVTREAWAGHIAASLLMGALAGVLFLLARLFVGPAGAALVALAAALGTPIWSVASRGLWSHTWTVLLLAIALLLVARSETGPARPRPVAVAGLLAAAYLTRPDAVGALVPLAVHVATRDATQRRWFLAAAAVSSAAIAGIAWLQGGALFVRPGLGAGVTLQAVPSHLLAQLVSPSRGFLWFVPTSVFVAYLLVRYRPGPPPLLWLGLSTIALHGMLQAWNHQWYGGYAYGPRVHVELVPFVTLLAALGLAARRDARARAGALAGRPRAEAFWGTLLLVAAVGIHARGAWSRRAWQWNSSPTLIDSDPSRVWDWREPQMLAGLVGSRRPALFPVWPSGDPVVPSRPQDGRFLGLGWDAPEEDFRWALGPEAELFVRRTGPPGPLLLRILGFPHEHPGGARQRMEVDLNGRSMGSLDIGTGAMSWRTVLLDAAALRPQNVVRLGFPDAASPRALGQGDDERPLGLAVRALRLDRFPALPADSTLRAGTDDDYLGSGWGPAEEGWRVLETPEAWVYFAGPAPDAALLRMEVSGRGPTPTTLAVRLNGIELDTVPVPAGRNVTRTVVVPRGTLGPDNVLRFQRASDAAVAIASFGLAGMPTCADDPGILPALPDHERFLLAGWSPPETDGSSFRWTDGPEARVVFALDEPTRYQVLRLTLGAFLERGLAFQRLQVTLNGHPLAPLVLRNALAEEYPLALPRGVLDAGNVLTLALPDARSPASLGTGDDERQLGVAVESIRLTK